MDVCTEWRLQHGVFHCFGSQQDAPKVSYANAQCMATSDSLAYGLCPSCTSSPHSQQDECALRTASKLGGKDETATSSAL